ncbi:E3 ubiquitin ligase RNF157 isoform X2 [Cataglyphis hispanica]|uniref:E3 ubiquitin ligase RNF157 isoform X2 n=1 Tax=Cataglyphis hispanica TaxID=1086592 RepID=UPI00217FC5BA|nr:E3 ubiquitin ligase RNF157 isoform X2 [Cataglyphis hispanica]
MGSLTSRQNAGVEEVDITSNHAYKYPPRTGSYFGSHFIMGGERFDTPQPEAYLFGENADLNFLGSRPTPFPYPPPQAGDPTKTLKSLVNIRKESLRLVRNMDQTSTSSQYHNVKLYGDIDIDKKPSRYNIEFVFDCDVKCAITIYYFCTEEISTKGVAYIPRDSSMNSETYHYKKGANQLFSQTSHIFDPTLYTEEDLMYNADREIIPIAIHCVAEEGSDDPKQSHTTIAVVEKHSDGTYVLKALKQKIYVDGLCYLLQEIYGIENKNTENAKQGSDEDTEDNGSECVICMSDVRDTLILPCRHLCLCNSCADSLRYQANNCPICRAPFRALLQIKALQKAIGTIISNPPLPEGSCENIPSGYEAVSLIEALNGPYIPRTAIIASESPDTPDTDTASAIQAAETLNRSAERTPVSKHISAKEDISARSSGTACPTPEFRMSVLLSRDEHSGSQKELHNRSPATRTKSVHSRDKSSLRARDTLRLVNEKQQQVSLYEGQGQDEDSEAEKLSPLLDAATSTEALDVHSHRICDIDIDDEIQNTENENDADITCHSH